MAKMRLEGLTSRKLGIYGQHEVVLALLDPKQRHLVHQSFFQKKLKVQLKTTPFWLRYNLSDQNDVVLVKNA